MANLISYLFFFFFFLSLFPLPHFELAMWQVPFPLSSLLSLFLALLLNEVHYTPTTKGLWALDLGATHRRTISLVLVHCWDTSSFVLKHALKLWPFLPHNFQLRTPVRENLVHLDNIF